MKDQTELKAKEILEYCCDYLGTYKSSKDFMKTKLGKEMLNEIRFMLETD
jgi:hypothetical protein